MRAWRWLILSICQRRERSSRGKARVLKELTFKTKAAIALDHLRFACAAGLPRGVVLMDAGYGIDIALRGSITAIRLSYRLHPATNVGLGGWNWAASAENVVESARPSKLLRRVSKHRPISVKKLAIGLPAHAWRRIT
jgi:SRSO17 transposase